MLNYPKFNFYTKNLIFALTILHFGWHVDDEEYKPREQFRIL